MAKSLAEQLAEMDPDEEAAVLAGLGDPTALQHDPGFVTFLDVIVETGAAVLGNGHGVASRAAKGRSYNLTIV